MVGAGTFPLVAAAVTAALLLTSCLGRPSTAVQGVTTDTITIGGFGPLTGPLSIIGLGTRDGMKLAVDEINANGGIRGRRINLIFENAEGPADSIAAARKLAEQDRVYAFVLGSGSVGAAAAADYLREAKLPVYNMVALTPQIHEPFTKTIFQGVVPSAAVLSRNLVAEVADRTTPRPSKVGILAGTFENPEAQLKELGPMFRDKGIETVVQRFDLGDKDFTSQLVALSRANVDVILYLGSFTEAALAIKQAPEKGLQGIPWVLDGAAVSTAIPTIAGPAAEGTRSAWAFPIFTTEDKPEMVEFQQRWQKAYGSPPPGRPGFPDLAGYGDMYVLATAIRTAGDDLSRDNLVKAWEGLKDVKPTTFGSWATDVIFPESFAQDNHQGNRRVSTVAIEHGAWKVTSSHRVLE